MILLYTSLILLFLTNSCSKDKRPLLPTESFDTIYIDVKQGGKIEYDTSIDNFLGAVTIVDSTNHHLVSELFSDSTGFNIYHRYQPFTNYLGNDTLKLKSERINDTSNEIISIKNITVIITVK